MGTQLGLFGEVAPATQPKTELKREVSRKKPKEHYEPWPSDKRMNFKQGSLRVWMVNKLNGSTKEVDLLWIDTKRFRIRWPISNELIDFLVKSGTCATKAAPSWYVEPSAHRAIRRYREERFGKALAKVEDMET